MVSHFVSILLVAFLVYTAWPGSSLFSYHPTLMAIGVGFFMFEALLVFNKESSLVQSKSRAFKATLHWTFQLTAVLCMLGGLTAIVVNKNAAGKPHWMTWHGTLGIITVGAACCQTIAGVILMQHGRWFHRWLPRLADMKLYHATSGTVLFTGACATMVLGMFSTWFTGQVTGTSWYACVLCTGLLALIVSKQVTENQLPRIRSQGAASSGPTKRR